MVNLTKKNAFTECALTSNHIGNDIVLDKINAIVLCGGKGIRLRPLTVDIPKPLVQVRGKPIIDFIIEFLRNQNVTDITVAGGYLVEKLEQHFFIDDQIKVIDTGDCEIIERLKSLLVGGEVNDTTLVLYGDTISDVNITHLISAHRESKCEATVTVYPFKSSFGIFDLDDSSRVTKYEEKPELDKWINIGYFVFSKSAIEALMQFKTMEAFLENLVSRRQLHAFKHRGIHTTVNSIAELEDAENLLASLEY